MCGITGYVGTEDCSSFLADSLKNLEYRGYDSVGVALLDGTLQVNKQSGQIEDLSLPSTTEATCGIGHTRWSTHGPPTDENAHPHTDCHGEISIVHNGIISNYEDHKRDLELTHEFTSDTDSEVIAHLLEEELVGDTDLPKAVRNVVEKLEGSFAIAVAVAGYDGIVAARQDSPLVVGHTDTAKFLASDITAFVEQTRTVTFLEDGDVAHLTEDNLSIANDGAVVERDRQTVDWDADAAEKSGYEHYMHKEIHEQPHAVRQSLSGRIDSLTGDVDLDIDAPIEYWKSIQEIQIVACGTSNYAARYAAELLETHTNLRVTVHVASEYEYRTSYDPWETLVIAVTQSGETADTLQALRMAVDSGARTLAVTNTVGSTVTREVDQTLYIRAGPEIGVAATKTFASQVVTLTLFTIHLGRQRDELESETATELLKNLHDLPEAIQTVLDGESQVRRLAERFANSDAFFYIGRRLGHPVALEGALKLKEISYDHAEGFPGGELKHGPLALVTEQTPVIALLTPGSEPDEMAKNIKEVQAREAPIIGIGIRGDTGKTVDTFLGLPNLGDLTPVLANVYLQLFAYHIANVKDRAIDKPRNLAKSVTVE
ncbi:glutamine--fructose-6-phosphate transaminase (isomerizing) [halophilic archaeon]|nr:glutamine--fructose-6-phosphate transaminase (isomerizing) [halophilic archaeon]